MTYICFYLKIFVNDDIIGLECLIVGLGYISLLGPRCDGPDINCITFDTVGCCQDVVPGNLESDKDIAKKSKLLIFWSLLMRVIFLGSCGNDKIWAKF